MKLTRKAEVMMNSLMLIKVMLEAVHPMLTWTITQINPTPTTQHIHQVGQEIVAVVERGEEKENNS